LKLRLLYGLRFVVGGPFLAVGLALDLDRLGNGSLAVFRDRRFGFLYLLNGVLYSVDVFALGLPEVIIRARASLSLRVNLVFAVAGL
jgi:hypothetical protein